MEEVVMTYDPNAFPTVAVPPFSNPNATLNNPDYSVMLIPGVNDPPGSIYYDNQVGFSKTLLINRIFNMLNNMIGVLQNAAAAQAQNLNVLSQWQQSYTDTMNQIHSFTTGASDYYDNPTNKAPGSGVPPVKSGSSNPLNVNGSLKPGVLNYFQSQLTNTNATYTTQLQNQRSIVSDQAKSMQTTLNQTTDAVSQQTSLATSLLQEISTLTTTILGQTS